MSRDHSRGGAGGLLFADAGVLPRLRPLPALDPEHAVPSAVSVPVSRPDRHIVRPGDPVGGTRGSTLHERARERGLRCATSQLRTLWAQLQPFILPSERSQRTVGTRRDPRVLVSPWGDRPSEQAAEPCLERTCGGSTVYVEFAVRPRRPGGSAPGVRVPAQPAECL